MNDRNYENFKRLYDGFIADNDPKDISNDVESQAYELLLYWLTPVRAKLPREEVTDLFVEADPDMCTKVFFFLVENGLLDHLFLFFKFKETYDERKILDRRQKLLYTIEQTLLNDPELFHEIFSDYEENNKALTPDDLHKLADKKAKETSIKCDALRNILLVELLRISDARHVLSPSNISHETIVHNLMLIYSIIYVNLDSLIYFIEHANPFPD